MYLFNQETLSHGWTPSDPCVVFPWSAKSFYSRQPPTDFKHSRSGAAWLLWQWNRIANANIYFPSSLALWFFMKYRTNQHTKSQQVSMSSSPWINDLKLFLGPCFGPPKTMFRISDILSLLFWVQTQQIGWDWVGIW